MIYAEFKLEVLDVAGNYAIKTQNLYICCEIQCEGKRTIKYEKRTDSERA